MRAERKGKTRDFEKGPGRRRIRLADLLGIAGLFGLWLVGRLVGRLVGLV